MDQSENGAPKRQDDQEALGYLVARISMAIRDLKTRYPGYNLMNFSATFVTPRRELFPFKADNQTEQNIQHGRPDVRDRRN